MVEPILSFSRFELKVFYLYLTFFSELFGINKILHENFAVSFCFVDSYLGASFTVT